MNPRKILIVEDEAVTALDIQDSVERAGHTVIGHLLRAEDVDTKLEDEKPDLILMDIKLQGEMDGIEAAQLAWEKHDIPSIFLTAFADEATLARAKLSQPYGYILKPFVEKELHAVLEVALYRIEQEAHSPGHKREKNKQEQRHFATSPSLHVQGKEHNPLDLLRRIDPFRALNEEILTPFANECKLITVSEKTSFAEEGDDHFPPFIVIRGRMALVKSSESGKELIVSLFAPGDILSVALAIDDRPAPYTARAQCETSVLQLSQRALRELLTERPELYEEFTVCLSERLEDAHMFSKRLAHEKVDVRIAAGLIALASNFAKIEADSKKYLLEITRLELADLTGTTPETAIRVTKKMEKAGLIDLTKPGQIVIQDLEGIERILQGS